MLEIKTIMRTHDDPAGFDEVVNAALRDGWELVRRDLLITPNVLYAELERETEPEEEELDDGTAGWRLSRTPALPFACTACGYHSTDAPRTCPNCNRLMRGVQ